MSQFESGSPTSLRPCDRCESIAGMNDWRMSKRIAIAVIFFGLMMIEPSSSQRPASGQISGHVVDTVGATIKGANVFLHKRSLLEDSVSLVAHTDIHGDFVLLLPEGGYDVLITSPAFVAEVQTIPVFPGKTRKVQWKLKALDCDFPGMNCDTFQ